MPNDYIHLRAWNLMMGSDDNWCRRSLEKARRERAPADAVYNTAGVGEGGVWRRFSDVENTETIVVINRIIAEGQVR